jgi:hypothetical protein
MNHKPEDGREQSRRRRPARPKTRAAFEVEDLTEATSDALEAAAAFMWVQQERALGNLPN